jgi:hypothetical protein
MQQQLLSLSIIEGILVVCLQQNWPETPGSNRPAEAQETMYNKMANHFTPLTFSDKMLASTKLSYQVFFINLCQSSFYESGLSSRKATIRFSIQNIALTTKAIAVATGNISGPYCPANDIDKA